MLSEHSSPLAVAGRGESLFSAATAMPVRHGMREAGCQCQLTHWTSKLALTKTCTFDNVGNRDRGRRGRVVSSKSEPSSAEGGGGEVESVTVVALLCRARADARPARSARGRREGGCEGGGAPGREGIAQQRGGEEPSSLELPLPRPWPCSSDTRWGELRHITRRGGDLSLFVVGALSCRAARQGIAMVERGGDGLPSFEPSVNIAAATAKTEAADADVEICRGPGQR